MSSFRLWLPRLAIAGAFAALTGGALPATAEQSDALTLLAVLAERDDKAPVPSRMTRKPRQIADRCGATEYYCSNPTPVCRWSQARGYYCAATLSQC